MLVLSAPSVRNFRESKALVVTLSVLQLALVVLAWLLALLPVAVMALCAMAFQAVKSTGSALAAPTSART
jgi:hypothetical protein